MSFFTRLSNGWVIAQASFKVLNAHKELIIFPILSALSLILVVGSFFAVLFARVGWNVDEIQMGSSSLMYLVLFCFYIINYFIVVFFNMALMHCAKLYFVGEEVSVSKGLQFSVSRIWPIFSWAVFAATVGMLLKIAQDNLGWIGKIIIGIVGFAWSIATFFAIPVIAYENLSPMNAVKRSAELMKQRWGEGIGASFSIGLVGFAAFIVIAIVAAGISAVNEGLGIAVIIFGIAGLCITGSALHSIFISALYNEINGHHNDHFSQQLLDGLFEQKG